MTGDLQHLKIYKDVNISAFFNMTFGQFPVIYLDFKELHGSDFSEFISSFMEMFGNEFDRHDYLLCSDKLRRRQSTRLRNYYKKIDKETLSTTNLLNGLKFLSACLYTHFNRRVIVLIDEFDSPVQVNLFLNGTDFEKNYKFYYTIYF